MRQTWKCWLFSEAYYPSATFQSRLKISASIEPNRSGVHFNDIGNVAGVGHNEAIVLQVKSFVVVMVTAWIYLLVLDEVVDDDDVVVDDLEKTDDCSRLSSSDRNLVISSSILRISASKRSRIELNSESKTEKSPNFTGMMFFLSAIAL